MKKLKIFLAALLVTSMTFAATGCGKSDKSSGDGAKENETQEFTMPAEREEKLLAALENEKDVTLDGELENKTIKWMADWDINPRESDPIPHSDLYYFQKVYGGNIEYHHVDYEQRYDKLAEAISSGEGIDFFYTGNGDAIPKGAIRQLFMPVDDYIDFNSPLWEDVKEVNDSLMWNDKHYTAIVQTSGDAVAVLYNRKTFQEAGLDDPAVLYENGEWTWDTFQELLEKFVDTSDQRFGIDGWWFEFGLINTIGVPPVSIEDGKLVNNLGSPDMEHVQNWIYEMYQKDLIAIGVGDYGWEAKPQYIGEGKLMFYPVGLYELYTTPDVWKAKYGEDAFFVPMPKDPESDEYYVPAKMEAYSIVSGASNPEGVAKYLDCKRYLLLNEEARAVADGAMFVDSYGWTQEMVDMKDSMEQLALDNPVLDISRGVSADCGEILDSDLRNSARGKPWNETFDSTNPVVQKYIDKVNSGEID